MRRTAPSILRERPPKQDDLLAWTQEVIPAVKELQNTANGEYRGVFDYTTESTAVFETAWTSDDLPGDGVWRVRAEILGFAAADGTSACYEILGLFYRTASGVATQEGSTAHIFTAIEGDAAWDVQFATSTNAIVAQVKGDATSSVNWRVRVAVVELT
jgi:hypothetical protein